MDLSEINIWKKVLQSDLEYLGNEVREFVGDRAVIILEGKMGVGKTTFIKSFLLDETTQSPSYNVLTETRTALHGDFYRIKDKEEIIYLELELYLEHKKYFLVEWGKEYLHTLSREVSDDFNFYFLELDFIEGCEDQRNIKLSEISFN